MRRVMRMMIAAVFVLGTVGTAQAQVIRFTANLSGNQETPAPGVLTGAFGTATVTLDLGTQVVTWSIDIFNMPSGTNNAHFHVGGPGNAGPTVVNIAFPPGISNDFNLSGSATAANLNSPGGRDQGIRSWEDFIQSLLGGQIYLNIHSAVNPGGEIRGQVIRVP
jgi:CHRD domain